SCVLGTNAKARRQIFVNRIDFVIVVRLDEDVADQDACEDRAEGELKISVVTKGETFAGRSKKCSRAGFRSDERGQNGPPCDLPVYVEQCAEVLKVRGGEAPARSPRRPLRRIVAHYFALDHSLAEICASFPDDPVMTAARDFCRGLRIIRQPKWECLATFICS